MSAVVRHRCRSRECFATHYTGLCARHRTRSVASPMCQLRAAHAGPCDYTLKIIPGWSGTSVVGTVVAGAAIGAWLALILAIVIEVTR